MEAILILVHQASPPFPRSLSLPLIEIRSSRYLSDKISNEGDIRVEFLQTLANVTNYRQDVATAQQMNHSVQQSLLQLQLKGEVKPTHCQLRGGTAKTNPLLLKSEISSIKSNPNTPAPWRPAESAPSQKAWWAAGGPAGAAAGDTYRSVWRKYSCLSLTAAFKSEN